MHTHVNAKLSHREVWWTVGGLALHWMVNGEWWRSGWTALGANANGTGG